MSILHLSPLSPSPDLNQKCRHYLLNVLKYHMNISRLYNTLAPPPPTTPLPLLPQLERVKYFVVESKKTRRFILTFKTTNYPKGGYLPVKGRDP